MKMKINVDFAPWGTLLFRPRAHRGTLLLRPRPASGRVDGREG